MMIETRGLRKALGGTSEVLAIAWCADLILVGYLWARAVYNRAPIK